MRAGQSLAFIQVFNAANAAGPGAPMLKAQMLATALNVYYSGGAGGNKIGAVNGNGRHDHVQCMPK